MENRERQVGEITKGHNKRTCGGNRHAYNYNCSDGLMGVSICQNIVNGIP